MRSQGQAKLKTFTLNSIILNAGPQRRPRADANEHCDGCSPTDNDSIQLRRPASRVSGARQVPFSVVSYTVHDGVWGGAWSGVKAGDSANRKRGLTN